MTTAKVYRPVREWKGIQGKFEDYFIGTITGLIIGGAAPQPIGRFPGTVSTEGQVGVPYEQDSGIRLQQGDMIVVGSSLYSVTGPRQWEEEHSFSGTNVTDDYYWMEMQASHGTGG